MTTTSSMEDISHVNNTNNSEREHRQENIIREGKYLEEGCNRKVCVNSGGKQVLTIIFLVKEVYLLAGLFLNSFNIGVIVYKV